MIPPIPILADAASSNPPAAAIGMFVVAGSFLVSAVSGVFALFITRREQEAHKAEVNRRLDVVEQEFRTIRSDIQFARDEIHESERRLAESGEHRAEAIHKRFNDVIGGISELRGQVNASKNH